MTIHANKELVRRYNEEIWNNHNLEKASEFMDDDFLEESIEHVRQFLIAFPDAHVTIEDLIAEGGKVVGSSVGCDRYKHWPICWSASYW
jgi:predicted ester cyclase